MAAYPDMRKLLFFLYKQQCPAAYNHPYIKALFLHFFTNKQNYIFSQLYGSS